MEKLIFGILRYFVLYMIKVKYAQVRVSHPSQTYIYQIPLSSFSHDLLGCSYRLLR